MPSSTPSGRLGFAGTLMHLAAYLFLWTVFTGATRSSWVVGIPTVFLALWTTQALVPTRIPRFKPLYAFVFLPFFLTLSFAGGVDVARRAMGRRVRVAPAVLEYSLRLAPGTPRFFFMLCISLLPGTLSADLEGDCLKVHVLDRRFDNERELALLEAHVARLFGEQLSAPPAWEDGA